MLVFANWLVLAFPGMYWFGFACFLRPWLPAKLNLAPLPLSMLVTGLGSLKAAVAFCYPRFNDLVDAPWNSLSYVALSSMSLIGILSSSRDSWVSPARPVPFDVSDTYCCRSVPCVAANALSFLFLVPWSFWLIISPAKAFTSSIISTSFIAA